MKIKRLLAGVIASAMAISAMAITASAATMADKLPEVYAYWAISTNDFQVQYWNVGDESNASIEDSDIEMVEIDGDGEYTIGLDLGLFEPADFEAQFNCLKVQFNKETATMADLEDVPVTVTSIKLDDTEIDFDKETTSIEFGPKNDDPGIHISSEWGDKSVDIVGNADAWKAAKKLTVTFTVGDGAAADAADDADDADEDEKPAANPTTGMPIAGAGLVVLATASLAAATIIKKK